MERPRVDSEPARRAVTACPELECIRHRLAPGLIAAAEQRARTLGVGADRVLIAARAITEDAYVVALAARLRVAFESLEAVPREACPLADGRLMDADVAGVLPLRIDGDLVWVIAPRALAARRLSALIGSRPALAGRIRLTSSSRLRGFVLRHGARTLAARAADALRIRRPELSAAPRSFRHRLPRLAAGVLSLGVAAAFPGPAETAVGAALLLTFLAWTALRLIGAATTWHRWPPLRLRPRDLPVYTLILALYDEAEAAEGLIAALRRLDYPPEKLDIKLVLEPDDLRTRAKLDMLSLGPPFEIVVAPDAGPRTKPKALNAALALARGTFTAVFDAEDRPEPDQLHRALDAFLATDADTACVQARLTIDNTRDGWLARLFTAEYAGLFDVLLPGLAQRRLPLPLGGSSNHFRTAALRAVGGWDPYNVTEDADLGIRLARFGYHSAVIASTTYEEAPARIGPWLRQRTRWFKGWMQTWTVHMRTPIRLRRALGSAGFATFQLLVGGTVLSALIHPLFIATVAYRIAAHHLADGASEGAELPLTLYGAALAGGYLASAVLGLIGLARRQLLAQAWVLLLIPLHWLLLSYAAWRALYQLIRDPYRWEKTAHGLARTSRLAAQPATAAVTIIRNSAAARPPSPRAAA